MFLSSKFSENSQGVLYMILCCFCVSIMVAIVRHLSLEFHIFFILLLRNFFALVFFIPDIIKDYQGLLRTRKINLHLLRGVNGVFSMFCWFYAISILPLSEAVSISFVIPITTTLVAMLFLKERVKKRNWLAIFIGLIGVLVILRPGLKEFSDGHYYVFVAVLLWTVSNITTKMMTRTEKPKTIVAYMSLIMLIISFPFALPHLEPINDISYLLWFLALGFISNLAYFSISFAYMRSNISLLQPFDFTRLIFTAIIAYFAFDEMIDIWTVVGSLIILIGVLIILPKKKQRRLKKIIQGEEQ